VVATRAASKGLGSSLAARRCSTIELVDRLTDQTIFRALKCQVTRQSWSVQPKQLVTGTFTWVGINFENEAKS
jgi:hypothetical protein